MHIPDGLLSPAVAAPTSAAGAVAFLACLHRVKRYQGERTAVLMGTLSSFVFAAQMVNFPVGPGVSGHLMGGVLAAVLVGPWAAAGVIGTVLVVQCLLFADGGLTALGANFLNMGVIGTLGAYTIYAPLARYLHGRGGVLLAAMVAAWFSVLLAAGAVSLELAFSGRGDAFLKLLSWMLLVHAAIGVGEAVITGLVLRFVLLSRPDLIHTPGEPVSPVGRFSQVVLAGVAVSLAVALFLAPLASAFPDGLEFLGEKLGFLQVQSAPLVTTPLADYQVPGFGSRVGLATAAAGVLGTLVVFGAGMLIARAMDRARGAAEGAQSHGA